MGGGEPDRAIEVRDAAESDLAAVLAIYNDVIATSTAVFSDAAVTLEDRREWWRGRVAAGYPVLVACDADGAVVGFGSFGDFRSWPGYRTTVEHSVHVRADARRSGVGSAIVRELVARAAALEKHVMIAGVDADNDGSIRMHERLGFTAAGRLSQVAWKFDHWLDLVLMERRI
jgi:L-amino acid N-acyltransferase